MYRFLRKKYLWIKKIINAICFAIKNYDKPLPIYPNVGSNGLKLHIGAGDINLQGWVNIDGRKFQHTHLVSDGFSLEEFSDASIEQIYMCHVLEHFSFEEAKTLLSYFNTKLKSGGCIRLSVPDFDALVLAYTANNKDLDIIKSALMGGQNYSYNFHKAVFNKASLSNLLESCGFDAVSDWNTIADFETTLGDWSNGTIYTPERDIPISLNLKALKP